MALKQKREIMFLLTEQLLKFKNLDNDTMLNIDWCNV